MKTTLMRIAIGAALVLTGFVQTARAQASAAADPSTVPQFKAEFDRATERGVPLAPLVGTARRGLNEGFPVNRIRDAIRGTANRYVDAREALNPVQGNAELDAGEAALQVGISKTVLRDMRKNHPSRSLAVPLGALQILVTKAVPIPQAVATVEKMLSRKDSDTRIASLGTDIQGLLATGLAPSDAFDALSKSVLSLPQSPAQGAALRLSDDKHRRRSLSLFLAAALTSAAASASWAQTDWRLDANFVRLRPAGASRTSALSILGLAQQQIGPFTPTLSGAATISGDSVAAAQVLMGVEIIPPWSERAPIEIGAVVALYGIAEGDRGQSRTLYLRQHLRYDRRGYWVGGAIGQIDRTVSFASNSVDAGGWVSWGRKRITASLATIATNDRDVFVHTALVPDQFAERFRVADASLTLEYATTRLEMQTTVGGRVAIEGLQGSRGFALASLAWRVARSARLVFSGGSQLADPLRGTPEWKFFSAGVRISKSPSGSVIPRGPAAPPVAAERLTDSTIRFTVDAPFSSTSVEVMGSFTSWTAVPLDLEGDTWVITLPAAPGAHRLRVRVNGGDWRVPSNLTPGRDEFGSRYGIIIVP